MSPCFEKKQTRPSQGWFFFLVALGCFYQTSFAAPAALKDYALTNSEGKSFNISALKGSYVLISFIYTRCPVANMCPLTMTLNRQVAQLGKKNLPNLPLKFLIVTLDPANDSPAELKKYGKKFGLEGASFILATGKEKVIDELSAECNAIGFPSNGLVAHSSKSVLVGPDLVPLKDYKDNEWKAEQVISDLKKFLPPNQK